MRDPSNVLQQQAIGILGVNLIYAAFYEAQTKESFLEGLAQDVVSERIEIDYVDLRGQHSRVWDHRALLVHLVRAGLAEAVFFPTKGSPVPPTEVLYKKAVVLAPGYSATPTQFTRMFICNCWLLQFKSFRGTLAKQNQRPLVFFA